MVSRLMRSVFPAILLAAVVAATTAMASAHMMGRGEPGGFGMQARILLRAANLTDAQRKQMHQILSKSHDTMRSQWHQLHAAHQDIVAKLTSSGNVKESDFSADMATISRVRGEMQAEMLKNALAIRKTLTPEQLQKVAEAEKQLQHIHGEFRDLMMGKEEPLKAAGTNSPAPSAATQTGQDTPNPVE
jgi:Spy/CpxP family protein refolding chaperone